jgi:hypothetical protein
MLTLFMPGASGPSNVDNDDNVPWIPHKLAREEQCYTAAILKDALEMWSASFKVPKPGINLDGSR